jgi:methionyl-tRNA formyltransferase
LPRWRGASPVVRAILAGDGESGVTLMAMDEGLDTGPIAAARSISIRETDTAGTLTARLASLGAAMILDHVDDYASGRLVPTRQDESMATAAAKVTVEEAFIDPARHTVDAVERAVRAFNPRPGAWSMVDGKRIRVLSVARIDHGDSVPGSVVVEDGAVVLGAVGGRLRLLTVQPEGRPVVDATAWMHGRRGEPATFGRPTGD